MGGKNHLKKKKTADFRTIFFVTLFFFKLSILSTGELETDKVILVEAKAGPKVDMLSTRPKHFFNENKSIKNHLNVTIPPIIACQMNTVTLAISQSSPSVTSWSTGTSMLLSGGRSELQEMREEMLEGMFRTGIWGVGIDTGGGSCSAIGSWSQPQRYLRIGLSKNFGSGSIDWKWPPKIESF